MASRPTTTPTYCKTNPIFCSLLSCGVIVSMKLAGGECIEDDNCWSGYCKNNVCYDLCTGADPCDSTDVYHECSRDATCQDENGIYLLACDTTDKVCVQTDITLGKDCTADGSPCSSGMCNEITGECIEDCTETACDVDLLEPESTYCELDVNCYSGTKNSKAITGCSTESHQCELQGYDFNGDCSEADGTNLCDKFSVENASELVCLVDICVFDPLSFLSYYEGCETAEDCVETYGIIGLVCDTSGHTNYCVQKE